MSYIHNGYFNISSYKKNQVSISKKGFTIIWFVYFFLFIHFRWGGKCGGGGLYVSYSQNIFQYELQQKKSGLYSQKWLHNDLICLYFPFFPLCGVVNVEVGGYMSSIHKIYLNMSSYQKNQVSTSKNGFTMF